MYTTLPDCRTVLPATHAQPVCIVVFAEGLRGSSSSGQQQGEPFMVAVQAVPTQFFQEGFFDTW